jgi:hypothetical protein
LPYPDCSVPQKVGSKLYFRVTPGEGLDDRLVVHDLDSREERVIFESAEGIGSVDANRNWLVWESDLKLYAQSLISGERTIVASSRDLYAPALEGDRLAWIDLRHDRTHAVVMHDLSTGRSKTISAIGLPGLYNNFTAWDGGKLLWTDVVDGVGRYRRYDSVTAQVEDFPLKGTRFRYPGYAVANGDRFYSINFDDTETWDWTTQQLGVFSAKETTFTPLVPAGSIFNYVRVAGDYLAVVDDKGALTLRSLTNGGEDDMLSPIDSPVTLIETSEGGTLVATYQQPSGDALTVYIIEPR